MTRIYSYTWQQTGPRVYHILTSLDYRTFNTFISPETIDTELANAESYLTVLREIKTHIAHQTP